MEVRNAHETLRSISAEPIRTEARQVLDGMRLRDDQWRKERAEDRTYFGPKFPPFQPTYFEIVQEYETRKSAVTDPTTLVLIDEADRLGMDSLEQVRSIFDQSDMRLVLIGMPGLRSAWHVCHSSTLESGSSTSSGRFRQERFRTCWKPAGHHPASLSPWNPSTLIFSRRVSA